MDKDTEDRLKIGIREWAIEEVRRGMESGQVAGMGAEDMVEFATKLEAYITKGIFDKEKS